MDPRLPLAIVALILTPPLRVLTEMRLRRRSEAWQVTFGRIDRMLLGNISGLWMLNIEYSYSADKKYQGLRLVQYIREKTAAGIAVRFATGSSAVGRYSPAHPEQSLLIIDDPVSAEISGRESSA